MPTAVGLTVINDGVFFSVQISVHAHLSLNKFHPFIPDLRNGGDASIGRGRSTECTVLLILLSFWASLKSADIPWSSGARV